MSSTALAERKETGIAAPTMKLGIAELRLPANIEAKIAERPTLCWEWTGAHNASGYGIACLNGRTWQAHRLLYMLVVGHLPTMALDHLCRNRLCVNPEHLEPVSNAENTRRSPLVGARNRGKTHCPRGHEYTPDNTMVCVSRKCRSCAREFVRNAASKRRLQ